MLAGFVVSPNGGKGVGAKEAGLVAARGLTLAGTFLTRFFAAKGLSDFGMVFFPFRHFFGHGVGIQLLAQVGNRRLTPIQL